MSTALAARLDALLASLTALQARVDALSRARSSSESQAAAAGAPIALSTPSYDLNGQDNELQQRLRALCRQLNIHSSYFRRTTVDYYERPLSYRRQYLQAPSEHYLCKSIIAVNTHCAHERHESHANSKYLLLVVQYTVKLDFDKVAKLVIQLGGGGGKRADHNWRLCEPSVSDALSGFEHNAVTPLGMRERVPIVVSDRVAALPFVWLGGGEVDGAALQFCVSCSRALASLIVRIVSASVCAHQSSGASRPPT